MESINNRTDRYFRRHLAGFEQSPPESTWEQIVNKIDNRRKKRGLFILFRIAAGMAILISTGLGIYLLTSRENTVAPVAATYQNERTTLPEQQAADNGISGISEGKDQMNTSLKSDRRSENSANSLPEASKTTTRSHIQDIPRDLTVSDSTEKKVDQKDILASLESKISGFILPDSLIRNLEFPDHIADTGLTGEEAAALLLAQYYGEDESQKEPQHRWTLGSELAPLYSYRDLNQDGSQTSVIKSYNESESGVLAYAGGFRIAVNTGKRLSVQSGIYYSRYGQEKNQVQAIQASNHALSGSNRNFLAVTNSTGTISGAVNDKAISDQMRPSTEYDVISQNDYKEGITYSNVAPLVEGDPQDVVLKQYFDYFEFPLILKYKAVDRKIDFNLTGGLVTNILVGNVVNMINDGEKSKITETTDISTVNYLGSVGLGLEYPVSGSFSLTVEPRFRYYLNPIDRSSSISVHPFSFGFFAGINYRF